MTAGAPEAPERDYEVGRGKPPVETRFAKGRSGNPRGRPKRQKDAAALLQAELDRPVTINENGKRQKSTKLQVIIKQAVNEAVKGKPDNLIKLRKQFGPGPAAAGPASRPDVDDLHVGSEEDEELLESLQRRLKTWGSP